MSYDPGQEGYVVTTSCTICGCDLDHADGECPCECHDSGRPPQVSGVLLIAALPETQAHLAARPSPSAGIPLLDGSVPADGRARP